MEVKDYVAQLGADRATMNEDGSVTFRLEYPVQVEGQATDRIMLRRVTGKAVRKISIPELMAGAGDDVMTAIGFSAAIPPSSVDQLDAADVALIYPVIAGFFGAFRQIGEAALPKSLTSSISA